MANGGLLFPRGGNIEITMRRDDYDNGAEMLRDGTFVRGPSEANTVRGHQLVSGIHDGCMISATESLPIAIRFATREGEVDGVVYVLDEERFTALGVVAWRLPDPRYPHEQEVSIRAADGGEIPKEVIVEVRKVCAADYAL